MFRSHASALAAVLFLGTATVAGCSAAPEPSAENPLPSDADFVAVPRPLAPAAAARVKSLHPKALPGTTESESFYIAINKKTLGQRWFLSAFLKQYFPGAVAYGAANSLGTKVVTFRVQNGKLFVFDASDGHASSDAFDPELIIDAYPLVADDAFSRRGGSDAFVLFDPAAGLNHFGVVSDAFASPAQVKPQKFSVELSFLQNFRAIADGVTYEQVFTGYSDSFDPTAGARTEGNQFHGAGTLGIALRKYAEGAGFVPGTLPSQELFFRNGSQLVKNTGSTIDRPIKWNIQPGMKPIQWVISDRLKAYVDANLPGTDVVGAVQRGIESWNDVFGFKVLEAHVGKASDGPDDDVNYLYFDEDPTVPYAFANWRTNPNTGEVRGASVYFNSIWLQNWYSDDPGSAPAMPKTPKGAPALTWGGIESHPLCAYPALHPDALGHSGATLTGAQKFERRIQHVVLHEIGHTLGLRHNFAGSLGTSPTAPSTSVMDYLVEDDSIAMFKPGTYDTAALKHLYQGAPQPWTRFCTDEQTATDPDCKLFDQGARPLTDFFGPQYATVLGWFASWGGIPKEYFPYYVDSVLDYVRAGSNSLEAWSILTKDIATPLPSTASPAEQAAADATERNLFTRLYLDDPKDLGAFKNAPSPSSPVVPVITRELGAVLGNVDGARSFASRRVAVDVLKKLQSDEAYEAILAARQSIVVARATMTGTEAAQTDDLLARIDAAIKPYFAK